MPLILSGWPLRNSSLACFLACPDFGALRGVLRQALTAYLPGLVQEIQKFAHPYSGSAVKGDGNFKIASRIKGAATHRFFN